MPLFLYIFKKRIFLIFFPFLMRLISNTEGPADGQYFDFFLYRRVCDSHKHNPGLQHDISISCSLILPHVHHLGIFFLLLASFISLARVVDPEWFFSDPTPDPVSRKFRLRLWVRIRQRWSPPRESCAANSHCIREITTIYKVFLKMN